MKINTIALYNLGMCLIEDDPSL